MSTKKLGGHETPTKTDDYQGAAASRLPTDFASELKAELLATHGSWPRYTRVVESDESALSYVASLKSHPLSKFFLRDGVHRGDLERAQAIANAILARRLAWKFADELSVPPPLAHPQAAA